MPAENNVDVGINLDWGKSAKSIRSWERDWKKVMQKSEKNSDKAMKGAGKAVQEFYHKSGGAQKMWSKDMEKANAAYKKFGDEIESSIKNIKQARDEIEGLNADLKDQNDLLKRSDELGKETVRNAQKEKDRITEAIKERQKALDLAEKANEARKEMRSNIKEHKENIAEKFTFDSSEIEEAAKEASQYYTDAAGKAGELIAAPFKSLLDKDLPNAAGNFAAWVTKPIQIGLEETAGKMGDILLLKASKMKHQGAMAKEAGASGLKVGAMKGMEKVLGSIGGLLKQLPMVMSLVNTTVVGLVKLFIDAEATVKGINKEILATASTSGYLSDSFGDADSAATTLEGTLKKISTAALSLDNIGWGISKEQHTAVISSLTAEGVNLKALESQYKSLNAETKTYSDSFGSITQMAVTYSREMGVSLQEVTQLQGEMMSEMGSGLLTVQQSFHQMSEAAADSGIAGNKFFAMIRGVSADMNLYNNRIEDATKLLGALGKVMSPKNAQQFLQASQGAMKNMDRSQRLQISLLAGSDFVKKRVVESVGKDQAALAKSIEDNLGPGSGFDAASIQKVLESGNEDEFDKITEAVKKKGGPIGDIQEAFDNLQTKRKESQGDEFAVSQAAGETSGTNQMEMVAKAASKFGGLGTIGGEMMAQQLGISHEELKLQVNFGKAMDRQKRLLKSQIKSGEAQSKLSRAGVKLTGKETEKQLQDLIDSSSWDTLVSTQDKATQEDQAAQKKAMEQDAAFAKNQGRNISTITDKLEVLVEWFMGQFYGVIMDIYDGILDLLSTMGIGDAEAKKSLLTFQKHIQAIGTKEQKDAMRKAGGNKTKYTEEMKKGVGEGIINALKAKDATNTGEGRAKQEASLAKETGADGKAQFSPEEIARKLDVQADLTRSMKSKLYDQLVTGNKDREKLNQQFNGMSPEDQTKALQNALADANADQIDQLQSAAEHAGLSKEDITAGMAAATSNAEAAGLKATTPGSIYTHDIHLEKLFGASMDQDGDAQNESEDQGDTLTRIYKLLKTRGIKIDRFVGDSVQSTIHDAVLDAANEALLDYYMIQKAGPEAIAKAVKSGMAPKNIMKAFVGGVTKTGTTEGGTAALGKASDAAALDKHAAGGMVTGVMDGLAQVKAAPGEGLASIGKGETIGPAGGGGGGGGSVKVELSLKGDLGRIIDARADDRYSVNRSREKFR